MDLLSVQHLAKKESNNYLLQDIHFTLPPGERIAIAGETGSGKTTLLKLIGGLLQPDEGAVFFEGQRVLGPWEKLIPGHPRIAYLSQHFELRNNYRVEEELESRNLLPEQDATRIYQLCRIDHLLKRKTTQLSGGERQRIVLAAWLTRSPDLLLLDEPYSNLDTHHRAIIRAVLHDVYQELHTNMILVSHEAADMLSWADRVLVLKEGKIVQEGSPSALYRYPDNEYVAGLFGPYNIISANTAKALWGNGWVNPKENKALLRPEQLLLVNSDEPNIKGKVKQVLYYGSYSMIIIQAGEQLLQVQSAISTLQPGDEVSVSAGLNNPWLLNG
ncbi:MAG: ABC transporter ATP-binding protein [Bacteroidetes bacterium]|nr:ABC transporter ATP-binding protein [Bacteroidota bacterium]